MRSLTGDTRAWTAPRSHSWLAVAVVGINLIGGVVGAARVDAASLSLNWTAPTTNADGSSLTDLDSYRVYLATSTPPCPSTSFFTVASPTTSPTSGQTMSSRVTGLAAGTTYFVRVTAVDTSGNESACSGSASGVAQPDFSVTPSAATSFGSVTIGSTADRTFTVQNTSTASLSGTATVGAPYSIVSGASFSLAAGASQAVTVRFRPTGGGTFAGNVNFTAGDDTMSRGVSGSGTSSPTATLSVGKNGSGSGTVTSTPAGLNCGSTCSQSVPPGTAVTLTATAATGSTFAGWSAPCSGTGTCVVTVSGASAVTATFNLVPGSPVSPLATPGSPAVTQLAVDASGVTFAFAWTAVTGATSYRYTAAFNDGSAAQQGTVTGLSFQLKRPYHASGAASTGFVCILSVNAAGQTSADAACAGLTVPARPTTGPVTLSVSRNGSGAGTVTSAPAGINCGATCSRSVTPGTTMTLTATAATSSTFAGWSAPCSGTGTCVVTVKAATSVTATFNTTPPSVRLSVTKSGSGTVTSAPAGLDCGADCIGDYALNSVVTLTATPAPGFGFVGFTGACVTSSPSCQVTMSAAKTVTATFARFALTVTTAGTGVGTVSGNGIACVRLAGVGNDCTESYPVGTQVTLTAAPPSADQSIFTGWTGACVGTNPTCVVTMNAAKAVTATFTSVKLTVTKVGSGTVTSAPAGLDCGADCVGDYAPNRVVTLTATPAPGFGFVGFTGACVTSSPSCQVTMSAAKTVTATFASFALTVTTAGTGVGTVSGNGIACVRLAGVGNDCTERYPVGTQVTLTAAPLSSDQSIFTGWTGACVGTNPTCVVTMNAAKAVTATFTSVKLTVTKVGSGTVTSAPAGIDCGADCVGDYAPNRVVTLTATPAPGFGFVGFTGACVTSSPSCQVTMSAAKTVTATFASFALTVTTAGTGVGTVSGNGIACVRLAGVGNDCTESYPVGTQVTLTAAPLSPDQSIFTGWTGACVGTNPTCVVTMSAAKAVTATFTSVKLTVTRLGPGLVTSDVPGVNCGTDCVGDYAPNKIVTLTAQPLSPNESAFTGWTGACVGTNPTCVVTMSAAKAVDCHLHQRQAHGHSPGPRPRDE